MDKKVYFNGEIVTVNENGDIAVAFFNMSDSEKRGFFAFVTAGINASCGVALDFCELYTGEKLTGEFEIEPLQTIIIYEP